MPKPRNIPTTPKQDIRSFFQVKTKPKEKTPAIDLSDDDVIPESPDVQIKSKKKEQKKKRVFNDSSDEEIFVKKSKKSSEDDKDNKSQNKTNKNKISEKAPLKEVKAVDIFGSGPIKRTEPIVKKDKTVKTEVGIHSDEEFEKSLLELDSVANTDEVTNGNGIDKNDKKKDSDSKDVKSKYFNGDPDKKITPEIVIDDTVTSKLSKAEKITSKNDDKEHKERKSKSKESQRDKSPKSAITEDSSLTVKDKHKREARKKSPSKDSNKTESNASSKTETATIKTDKQNKDKPVIKETQKSPYKVETVKNEKKRDFSEFVADDHVEHEDDEKQNKKTKFNKSLNSSVLSDEERYERKRHSAILYQNYMNRTGPKNLGAKEMSEGSPGCLKDCAFLLTGVLDSFEREEIVETITKYGGVVKSGISKKVTHVLAGDDAGPAKMAKAQDLGITILNEDDFLQMIRDSKTKKENTKGTNPKEKIKTDKTPNKTSDTKNEGSKKKKVSPEQMKSFEEKIKSSFYSKSNNDVNEGTGVEKPKKSESEPTSSSVQSKTERIGKYESKSDVSELSKQSSSTSTVSLQALPGASSMWVEKYKPQTIKQIIGQTGDASNVKKLMNWLTKWYLKRKEKIPKPSPWAKNDDGAYFKAALLSGPPGVGKTTTVTLVCKELGFDAVEFNASDTRNKTLIREQIGELLTTTSLSGFAKGNTGKSAVSKKHVLVMDEVDGMAGNEDRGGLQELISLIKTTSVPIICMCNDRNSEKMRTLVNYCYDLKFSRPRVEQIKAAMLSVCFKEGIKVRPDVLTQLIVASNQDVRQTLNSLSMWAADAGNMDQEKLKQEAGTTIKDTKLGPWEALRKVFSAEDHKTMSINDKSDLFFYDYNISPLFVQQNYLSVAPHCPKEELLVRISRAADSISAGDLAAARVRGGQAWGLLPTQAMYSSVIPGSVMSGHVTGQIQFPAWLGNNSRHTKMKRLAQEIHAHTRISTTGSKSSIFLDYARHLRDAIVTPLIQEKQQGIPRALQLLQDYHLLREDLDSLAELALWPGQRDPMILVDSKVKAAMTRAYNKLSPALPHAAPCFSRGRGRLQDEDQDADDEEPGDEDALENDAMIKVKKNASSTKATDADKPGPSKAKKGKSKK